LNARAPRARRWQGLLLAELLSVILLALSYLRIVGDVQSKGFRGAVLQTVFGGGGIWGTTLARNVAFFVLALLLLYLMFGLAVWLLARASAIAWPSQQVPLWQHVFIWFIALTIALLAHNAAVFPRSSMGSAYATTMMVPIAGVPLGSWIAVAALAAALVAVAVAARRNLDRLPRLTKPVAIGAAVAVLATVVSVAIPSTHAKIAVHSRPNVVLIGVDSLRTDMVAPQTSPGRTPKIAEFLSQSVSFDNAITPLARTFPSVTTLITGRVPHRTGAVVNLLPRDLIQEGDTLGKIMRRAGYYTAYATDEVRFSNIDATYGYDSTVMPPIGASEFMLSLFADTPVSNLVINTALGKFLFPHIYANRGAALIYDPDRFLARIDDEVEFSAPMLLHVHLTLSHWPYTWIDAPVPRTALGAKTDSTKTRWPEYYLDAAQRTDRQFADLITLLKERGVLENAIVAVYSDHGESFGYPSESVVPIDTSAIVEFGAQPKFGHGTSVLAPHQYHTVLGIRGFGAANAFEPRTVSEPVAIQDIAPTLVDLLSASTDAAFDGRSLAGLLRNDAGAAQAFAGRVRFTETEYDPANVISPNGQISGSAVANAVRIYSVDPNTDRIQIRRSKLEELLHSRQYSAMGSEYLVAALPTPQGFQYVAVNLKSGTLMRIVGAPGPNDPAEVHTLWAALKAEFAGVLQSSLSRGTAGL
jgi:arylsulfatase A-like enzyme